MSTHWLQSNRFHFQNLQIVYQALLLNNDVEQHTWLVGVGNLLDHHLCVYNHYRGQVGLVTVTFIIPQHAGNDNPTFDYISVRVFIVFFTKTRPSKQCELYTYLLDNSVINQGCQCGFIG